MKYDAVVVASGKGLRAGLGYNKVFYVMKNQKTVLENSCSLFLEDGRCQKVVVVLEDNLPFSSDKIICVKGGKERKDSVYNGLLQCESEYVLIHDGARPFLSRKELDDLLETLENEDGAILALKAVDTIKQCKDGYIEKTIDRSVIYLAQTPQAFRREKLTEDYKKIINEGVMVTDDASVFEYYRDPVKIVIGSKTNRKLTNPEDFEGI